MVLSAAFEALLSRLAGQDDLVVGTPSAGRDRRELEGLIGMFVDTVPLRARLEGDPTAAEMVDRARAAALRAFTHQELPFDRLVAELAPRRTRGVPPLVQVLLVLQNTPRETPELPGLRLETLELESGTAKFDLELALEPRDGGLAGDWRYSTALFDRTTVGRMAEQYRHLLEAMLAAPERRLSELPLLSAAQRQQTILEWNDTATARPVPGGPTLRLDARVRAQAARTPTAVAVVGRRDEDAGGAGLTYGELARRTAALAARLRAAGVGSRPGDETRVGVCLPRTPELIVALLAVLEAGGAYVPLDAAYPEERLAFMLEDSGATVVLASGETRHRLPLERLGEALGTPVTVIDPGAAGADAADLPAPPSPPADDPAAGRSLAYLIYTSGSTGRPKGVAISHGAAGALLDWAAGVFTADELAGVLAGTSVCFDLSVFEIFLPLATGGRIVLAADALGVAEHTDTGAVTLLNTVPSAIKELVAAGTLPRSVRTVNLAGEPLQGALVDAIFERFPGVERIYNLYGPSEDTTYSTCWRAARTERTRGGEPTIGVPIAGGRAHVVDRALRPAPIGVPGELCLAGDGLARGYLGRPARTAASFVPDPFAAVAAGGRLYRTGDLARRRPDGEIEFLGRLDHQVKIRGFRIELGEIEAALLDHPRVAEAVVAARAPAGEGPGGESTLVAYVVPSGASRSEEPEPALEDLLRSALGERLPAYMVPAAFEVLDALPLTPNGKVDRKALPEPTFGAGPAGRTAAGEAAAPRTPTEERLAALFTEVLSLPSGRPVGRDEDFFRLGGHSLLATRLVARIRAATGVEIPVATLFEAPTVAGLARRLDARAGTASPADATRPAPAATIPRRPDPSTAPLTYPQERLWFLARLDPEASTYNMPGAVRMAGRLDLPVLAGALTRSSPGTRPCAPRSSRPASTATPRSSTSIPAGRSGRACRSST